MYLLIPGGRRLERVRVINVRPGHHVRQGLQPGTSRASRGIRKMPTPLRPVEALAMRTAIIIASPPPRA